MDLQAQDRAHRIGQTRPVLIFRLVSAHTIETKILQKAGNKRKLEALVISQGKFGRMVDENGRVLLGKSNSAKKAEGKQGMAEMARALLDLEGEEIDVASKDDMIIRWVPFLTFLVSYFSLWESRREKKHGVSSADLMCAVMPISRSYLIDRKKPWLVKSVGQPVSLGKAMNREQRKSRRGRRLRLKSLYLRRMMLLMVWRRCLGGMRRRRRSELACDQVEGRQVEG